MLLDTIHIANQYPQQGDTLLSKIVNLPQQINVSVDAPELPDSIGATTFMSAKDSTFVDSIYSALNDSIIGLHSSLTQLSDTVDSVNRLLFNISEKGIGYPDSIQIWAMPIFIALFAMAVPLLIQHVNGLDGKYSATTISDAFKSDWVYLLFWITFAVTLVLFGIWVILFIGHPGTHSTMEKTLVTSAFLFLFAVVLMIIKLLIYSSPEKLKWFSKEMFKWWKSLKK
ncbi:MAG: hypothetical protein MJZ20_07895 [Bacteroidaceae bacterium]|nr:hypothetical protein [Bacteroidaceae bacterium]